MKEFKLYDKKESKDIIKNNQYKERLQEILQREDVATEIEENIDELLLIIPEIKKIIGFKLKHPEHHLDVWQHTLEVIRNLNTTDIELNMAGLLHDISKSVQYQDDGEVRHYHGHPEVSYEMTKQILSRLNYDERFIDRVSYLVRKHNTPIDVNNYVFKLDRKNKYTITTDLRWKTMQNDGGSHSSIYYQIDLDNNIISKVQEDYHANLGGTPSQHKNVIYIKKIDTNIQSEVKSLLNEIITKQDINETHNYNFFTIKSLDAEKDIYNVNTIESINSLLEKIDELNL